MSVQALWEAVIQQAEDDWTIPLPPVPKVPVRAGWRVGKQRHGYRGACRCANCCYTRIDQQVDLLQMALDAGRFLFLRQDDQVRLAFDGAARPRVTDDMACRIASARCVVLMEAIRQRLILMEQLKQRQPGRRHATDDTGGSGTEGIGRADDCGADDLG